MSPQLSQLIQQQRDLDTDQTLMDPDDYLATQKHLDAAFAQYTFVDADVAYLQELFPQPYLSHHLDPDTNTIRLTWDLTSIFKGLFGDHIRRATQLFLHLSPIEFIGLQQMKHYYSDPLEHFVQTRTLKFDESAPITLFLTNGPSVELRATDLGTLHVG